MYLLAFDHQYEMQLKSASVYLNAKYAKTMLMYLISINLIKATVTLSHLQI